MKGIDYEKEFKDFLAKDDHLGKMVHKRAAKYGEGKIAVRHKAFGEWEEFSWGKFTGLIDACAMGLLDYGVKEGEFVGIFSNNRVELAVVDFACFSIRACSVPIYQSNSAEELKYIVNDCGIKILFVEKQEHYDKAVSILKASKNIKLIVIFDHRINYDRKNKKVMLYTDFIESGKSSGRDKELAKRLAAAKSEDLSTLIYTSGTTGEPKGVKLTHKNWLAMLFATGYYIPIVESDVNLAFLPLAHVFERAWSYFILCSNARVDYCHEAKPEVLLQFLQESKPHYMCSVPRLWEKVYAKVHDGLSQAPAAKQKLFHWAIGVGREAAYLKKAGKPLPAGLAVKFRIADALVLKKVRNLFGGRNKVYNCGGSAFSGEISEFFFSCGVLLLQGYGMTECFVISVSNPERNKFGTCGPVVPLMKVRISAEGEIQAKSPSQTPGYWKKPKLDKELFTKDGWVRTGDIGYIDDEGFIVITDRLKDMFKTSGGKYIAPQQIETLLKEDIFFEQVAAIGDGKKYVSALIVPNFEQLEQHCRKSGIKFSSRNDLVSHTEVQKLYAARIEKRTSSLGQVEKVKRFTLLPNEFSQETGELTPTLKIKRKVISEKYKDIISSMYRE